MYWKYLKYVFKHKWYVFLECYKYGLIWKGIVHDMSKFRLSEFVPYARYFYGKYPEYKNGVTTKYPHLFKEDIKRQFDKAWLLHIHRNPHHWQYWLLQGDEEKLKVIPMPLKCLKEMVCDWIGAGKAIAGKDNLRVWYMKNKDKIKLGEIDKKWIEGHFINK